MKMSTPDSVPPPPYSPYNTGDQFGGSAPYNPGYPATQYPVGYAAVPPSDPNYCGQPQAAYYGPPPVPMMAPSMPQQSTVIVNQPYVQAPIVVITFGEMPIQTTCPHCHQGVMTETNYEAGLLTWIICIILAVFGCWIVCCLIPFCIDSCKDVVHNCPNCRRRISVYRRIR